MSLDPLPEDSIDFDAADMYLRMAREANQRGETTKRDAAIHMVAVALRIETGPRTRFHLGHLSKS